MASHINFWAVLVAALAQMVVGFIWFSPMLFFKQWLAANGITTPNKPQGWIFGLMIILTLISTAALASILNHIGSATAWSGIVAAGFVWAATLMPFIVGTTLSTNRKFSLIALEFGHTIIGLLVAGAILGTWH